MAGDKQNPAINKGDELTQETDKCAASDDSKYVEVDDALIKDDEFQPLLQSLAPKQLDMGAFSNIFGFDETNIVKLIDSMNKSMQTLAPFLEEIEHDPDNFTDGVLGFDNSEELESLQAYFEPVEYLDFNGILQHMVDGLNHLKRSQTDTLKDTYELVTIGLKHGDVRRDQLEVISSDDAQRIVELSYWFNIPLRSAPGEKVRLRDDTLTFVRAIICFPHAASYILFQPDAFAKNGVESLLASEKLPEPMKHIGFCGLIPKSCDPDLMKTYVYAHAAYMVDLGKLVNPDDKRSLKEMVLSQVECSKAGVHKVPYDDEFRAGKLGAVGLTDAGVFKKIVEVCNNACKVVGEPELDFATAEKNHIKNGMVCFFEDENKDVAAGELAKGLADKNELFASKD